MSDVIVGRDGAMFLATSVHSILDHLTGKIEISNESIDSFAANVRSRSEYCSSRGIVFKHVIFPDKSSCLRAAFPIEEIRTFSDRYRHHFDDNVVDLERSIDDWSGLFLRTDTHLNFAGKVETILAVLARMGLSSGSEARAALLRCRGAEFDMLGDLGSKVDPQEREIHHRINAPFAKLFDNQVGANDGLSIVVFNKDTWRKKDSPRLLIFADSFMERSLRLLSNFYREILFCRTRYFHPEIVDMFRPDHLISASAERYFSNVRLDEVAPRFDLVYGLRGHPYSTNADFYKAYNAVLNYGRPQYEAMVTRLLAG